MSRQVILCIGDSNTWGYDAATQSRHPFEVRWTGVLQESLASTCRVIEEGLNGRTTVFEEPFRPGRNGSSMFGTLLESHAPLDLVIIALGANDLKPVYSSSASDSALGLARLVTIALSSESGPRGEAPGVIVLPPTRFGAFSEQTAARFNGAHEKFPMLLKEYKRVATTFGVEYFDPNEVIVTSKEDGVHLDAENHHSLGKALAQRIQSLP